MGEIIAQIFLGIWMLTQAACHFFGLDVFLRQYVRDSLSKEERASFQRGMVLPYLILGMTFIGMGIVERKGFLSMPVFLGLYIILCAASLAGVLRNNKKHLGHYMW
ncbi:hypothetical protein BK147_05450 [Paenibacillus sp. FSL R7-0337]|nr:hypothetical protein C162_23650 [Paenibacillus sp. FSL R7-269]OMF99774.1 hypothetical protein BK147_05450 [Paenibacillus sp. FSL R7-0337]